VNARPSHALCLILLGAPMVSGSAELVPGAPAAPAGYRDRLIDGGNLPVDVESEQSGGQDASGWPRALFAEAVASRLHRGNSDLNEAGARFGGMIDTPHYGAFTLDATVRLIGSEGSDSGNMLTLVQRGLPVNSHWYMNNSVGVVFTPMGELARRQARFFVPTIQMNGTAMEWRRGNELQAFASYGEPSIFTGVYVPTVESLKGRQASGGLQLNFADHWSVAAQVVDVQNVRTGLDESSERISAQSWFGAVAWGTPDARVQLNLADSKTENGENRFGSWVDATLRSGRTWHSFGAFHLEPELIWGNQQLASDSEGVYYRAAYQSRRWTLDGGVDYVASMSGASGDVAYGTGYARYQYSSRMGFGGGANVRQNRAFTRPAESPGDGTEVRTDGSEAWSAFGFLDATNRWGIGRGQLNYARDDRQDGARITLDQTWNTRVGRRLSTALAFGRENLESRSDNTAGIALHGGGDLGRNLSVDANASWTRTFGDASSDDLLANVALNWGFARGWTASANYYQNHVSGRLPISVTSPVTVEQPYEQLSSNDSGLYLSLRYDWRAGSPSAPLGGVPGNGSGSIAGILFLDENDNGRLDAGEAGAANVAVLLNGRFAARTDTQGRFSFPAVVAGDHYLTVVPDNLPLAWLVPPEARFEVQVGVRGQSRVELPARKQR
jgi:hypothetical protein